MKRVLRTGGLILLTCLTSLAQNQITPTDDAVRESIRREAAKIELRQRLTQAQEAQKRGEFNAAAKLYEDCITLIRHVSTGIDLEQQEVLRGIVGTRLALAEQSKVSEAEVKLIQATKIDPNNRAAFYYLELIKEQRYRNESAVQQQLSKGMLLDISKAWNQPITRDALPSPNPMARTNLVNT